MANRTSSADGSGLGSRSFHRGQAFVSHEAALEFLNGRENFERSRQGRDLAERLKLDRMRALMASLGDPQQGAPFVHVAGSKGKGSTCEMVASSLGACGYTVGLFTSPHLVDVRERVRVGGHPTPRRVFDAALATVRDAAGAIEPAHGACTYFEVLTALGLLVFAEQAVDIAVIEVGLGGRLDCTNVVTPTVVALTSIHLEHTQILGDTLELVAREKAGIIKPGVVALTVPQEDVVMGVFRDTARQVGAELKALGEEVPYSCRFESAHRRGPHPRVCVGEEGKGFEHQSVPLLGEHQAVNCGLALAVLCELRTKNFVLPEPAVARGLEQTPRAGRLEEIHAPPRVLVDGAHTPESVRATLRAAGAHMKYDSLVVIFGCAVDKDIDAMLDELARGADKVIFTRTSLNPRAADPDDLARRFAERTTGTMSQAEATVKQAVNAAARAVGPHDMVLVTGSFYLAGEVKNLFEQKRASAPARVGAGAVPGARP